jgi:hypothetical protein
VSSGTVLSSDASADSCMPVSIVPPLPVEAIEIRGYFPRAAGVSGYEALDAE